MEAQRSLIIQIRRRLLIPIRRRIIIRIPTIRNRAVINSMATPTTTITAPRLTILIVDRFILKI